MPEVRAFAPRTAADGVYTAAEVAQAILNRMFERTMMGGDSGAQVEALSVAYATVVANGEIGITTAEHDSLMSALASTPELQAVVQRLHVIR